jgi:hypothetical protein
MIIYSGSQVGGGSIARISSIVIVLLMTAFTSYSQYFKDTFEPGIRDEYWAIEGHSNTVSKDQSVSESKSYRSYLPAQVYENARSEIRFRGGNGTPNWHPHFSTWGVKLAVFFPSNFQPDNTSSELIFQFHGVKDPGDTYTQNPWSMRLRGTNLSVTNRWISKKIASDADQHEDTWNIGDVVPGKWHYFVVDIHWDYRSSGNGFMQVYMKIGSPPTKNDIKVDYDGPTGYNDNLTSYFKMGIYKWDWKDPARLNLSKSAGVTQRLLYYDNFEIQEGGFLVGSTNQSPTANAGPNRSLTLPDDDITVNGSASDPDGNLDTYQWTQISGPSNATMKKAHTLNMEASNLQEGVYVFRLTVEDTNGASDTDDVQVTVNSKVNQPPTANAGTNRTITLPTNEITLVGSASDPDGNLDTYQWTQISGPSNATMKKEHTLNMEASNLQEGVYVFRLTVTDTDGESDDDGVQVIVNSASNQPPVADAGSNKTITLPTDRITINGSGTDPDGNIYSYSWKQTSGPANATLSGENTSDLTVSNLVEGTYVFRLTVTDADGESDDDGVQVIVNSGSNHPPVADAGANKTITLPTNKVTLNGSGTDVDGEISEYLWSQVSGPSNASMAGTAALELIVSNLVVGVYEFQLKVTDNENTTDSDKVRVTVYEALPVVTATIDHAICTSQHGTIGLSLDGGAAPFQYEWSNGVKTKDLNDLPAGEYQVIITDANGNSLSKLFTVKNITSDIQVTAQITNANCSENNGSIEVAADGGVGPYSYEWSSQARTSSLSQLSGGSYDLVVIDQNGCTKKLSFDVGTDAGETDLDVSSTVLNTSCAGNDGSISLSVNGTEGPYSFVWEHGITGQELNGLEDGIYTVTITDKHGCFMNSDYTVNQDPGPNKPIIIQSADSLYVTQQAANYQWFKDSVAVTGANQQVLKITTSGTYSVQISNDLNCQTSSDYFYAEDPPLTTVTPGNQTLSMQQLDIYPNPVADNLHVRLSLNEPASTSITIFDFQGRVIENRELGVVQSQLTENININHLPSGTFLIRIRANQELITRRFIVL